MAPMAELEHPVGSWEDDEEDTKVTQPTMLAACWPFEPNRIKVVGGVIKGLRMPYLLLCSPITLNSIRSETATSFERGRPGGTYRTLWAKMALIAGVPRL